MNGITENRFIRELPIPPFYRMMQRDFGWKAVKTGLYECPKHGEFQCTTYENADSERTRIECPKCREEADAMQLHEDIRRSMLIDKRLAVGLPDDIRSVTFDDLTPRDEAERMACEWGRGFSQQYRNLCVMGRTGPGKSWLAGAIVNDCLVNRKSVMYATEDTIMNRFKASFVKWPERTEQEITDELISKAVLVIDEIGQGDKSDWRRRKLYEIISERISKCRSTVCISNRTPEEFRAYLGDPIISRLRISGKFITYTGSDRRGEKR